MPFCGHCLFCPNSGSKPYFLKTLWITLLCSNSFWQVPIGLYKKKQPPWGSLKNQVCQQQIPQVTKISLIPPSKLHKKPLMHIATCAHFTNCKQKTLHGWPNLDCSLMDGLDNDHVMNYTYIGMKNNKLFGFKDWPRLIVSCLEHVKIFNKWVDRGLKGQEGSGFGCIGARCKL